MRIILYANEAFSIVFPNGKLFSIWSNGMAQPGGIICNGKIKWGEQSELNIKNYPTIQLSNTEKTLAFAFGADPNKMYGHTIEDSIWISVYDKKYRGHDVER